MPALIKLEPRGYYYIHAPLALTGKELQPETNVLVEIRQGRIASVRSGVNHGDPEPATWPGSTGRQNGNAGLIKLEKGLTLLPALVDAHLHLGLLRRKWPGKSKVMIEPDMLAGLLRSGITAVRDGGDRAGLNLKAKQLAARPGEACPLVVATGSAMRRHDHYGSFLGHGYRSVSQVSSMVSRGFSRGIDQLKVVVSGIVSFNSFGTVDGKSLKSEELAAITGCAREFSLPVMAHASSPEAVAVAVKAGVDSVEHGYYVQPDTLALMAEKQVAWVPTVIPVAAQLGNPPAATRSGEQVEILKRIVEDHLTSIAIAAQEGLPLGLGTDAGADGVKHGSALVEEMLLYAKVPLSNQAILRAATVVNSRILALGNSMGLVEVGYSPRLLAVRGNPLENLAALREIAFHFVPVR